jgi:hypothetical protein
MPTRRPTANPLIVVVLIVTFAAPPALVRVNLVMTLASCLTSMCLHLSSFLVYPSGLQITPENEDRKVDLA